jgi:hypothetical protein
MKRNTSFKFMERLFWHHHTIAQKQLYADGSISDIWIWAKSCLSYLEQNTEEDRESNKFFMSFFLARMKNGNILFLSLNILFMVVLVYIIAQKHFGVFHISLDPLFESYEPAIAEIVIWGVLSAMCLGYFVILEHRPQWFKTFFNSDECEVWYELAAAILATRFFMFLAQVVNMLTMNLTCIDEPDVRGAGVPVVGYMIIKGIVDLYQHFFLVMMPFPQQFVIGFIAIEWIKQMVRLNGCITLEVLGGSHMWVLHYTNALTTVTYIAIIFFPSFYLEHSVRNEFKSAQQRQQAEASKREMVEFLSSDVRVPLQYMLYVIETVDFMELSKGNASALIQSIHNNARQLNDTTDDVLLMTCILEDRYVSRPQSVPNLHKLVHAVVDTMIQSREKEEFRRSAPTTYRFSADIEVPSAAFVVDEKCVVAVLRQLLNFIVHMEPAEVAAAAAGASAAAGKVAATTSSPSMTSAAASASSPSSSPVNSGSVIPLEIAGRAIRKPVHLRETDYLDTEPMLLQLRVRGYDKTCTKSWTEERRVHEATTFYICNTIAVRCGGTFEALDFEYILTLPCTQPISADHFTGGTATTLGGGGNFVDASFSEGENVSLMDSQFLSEEQSSPRHSAKVSVQKVVELLLRFELGHVCVIASDMVLQNVIKGILDKMSLIKGLTMLNELPLVGGLYVPRAKLTFVTTYKLCTELRFRKYPGMIVLFSGSSNYLDPQQQAAYDYCLPLPCTDQNIYEFLNYLLGVLKTNAELDKQAMEKRTEKKTAVPRGSLLRKARRSDATTSAATSRVTRTHFIVPFNWRAGRSMLRVLWLLYSNHMLPGIHYCFNRLKSVLFVVLGWFGFHKEYFGVVRIPFGMIESYTSWKLLNPASSWYHMSTEQGILFSCRAILLIVEFYFVSLKEVFKFFIFAYCILQMNVSTIDKYILKKWGIPLHSFWIVWHIFYILFGILPVAKDILSTPTTNRNLKFSEFLGTQFANGYDGTQFLVYIINSASYLRLSAIYAPHPMKFLIIFLVFLPLTIRIWFIMIAIASPQLCQFLFIVFFQINVSHIVYFVYLENAYRREFFAAHEHILTKAYLDQCLHICQRDIRKPLQILLEHQNELWAVLTRAARQGNLKLDAMFLAKLEPLHVSRLLLSEMRSELEYDSAHNLTMHMEAVQLPRALAGLIAGFYSSSDEVNVRIYAEVDTKLSVVLVDWKMLSVILTNMLNIALKNIRAACSETLRDKDFQHTILMKFVGIEPAGKVTFVHPRTMLVNICDDSDAARLLQARSVVAQANQSKFTGRPRAYFAAAVAAGMERPDQRWEENDIAELFDGLVSRYGNTVCEKLVRKFSIDPIFQTICPDEGDFRTVQRFTFNYRQSAQTFKAYNFVRSEVAQDYLTINVLPSVYQNEYNQLFMPSAVVKPLKSKKVSSRRPTLIYLSAVIPEQRQESINLRAKIERAGWNCSIKYLLGIPRMATLDSADCLLIDQQLEIREKVSICDLILKLRVCGFNGVIGVILRPGSDCGTGGAHSLEAVREDLKNSAASPDVCYEAPIESETFSSLLQTHEKAVIRHLLFLNSN